MRRRTSRASRRACIWVGLIGVCLWLALSAIQPIYGPFDGYVPIHIAAPGALHASGPFLAEALLELCRPLLSPEAVRLVYSLLLILLPLFSIAIIVRLCGMEPSSDSKQTRALCIGIVVFLAVLAGSNLTFLSNDVYLYRLHGQMLLMPDCSPYSTTPDECLSADVLTNVPWTNQKSPYGPLALIVFAAASLGGGIVLQFWTLKLMLTLPWAVMLIYLYRSRRFGEERRLAWFVWMGLNPLLILEVLQNGHLEGWLGALLFFLILALLRASYWRAVSAGILLGLACAIKLSIVVIAPTVLVWLAVRAKAGRRPSGDTALLMLLFLAPAFLTLGGLYLPFWRGVDTFAGIQQESEKILRSLYFVLAHYAGMSPVLIRWSSILGNVCAGAVGMLLCARGRGLAEGVIAVLLIQALLGRTFLQPWHFCPVIMLAPLLAVEARKGSAGARRGQRIGAADSGILWSLLAVSASAIAGGYAVLCLAGSRSPRAQLLSFLCMVIFPFALWIAGSVASRVRSGAIVKGDDPR